MSSPPIPPHAYLSLGKDIMRRKDANYADSRRFASFFGHLRKLMPKGGKPEVLSSTVGVDEKTFRKWVWFFVDALSFLESDVVSNPFSQKKLFFVMLSKTVPSQTKRAFVF